MSNGVVFAVAGSKGGVGKTTTSINLSAVLAEAGYDVVLVEVDLAMANVGDFLDIDVGLEGEDPTLHEVLAGTATVVDATYDSPCGFDVVPSGASLRGFRDADVGRLSEVLATLRFAYDVVVLDTGAGVTVETVLPLALADETILVSSPRVASVRDTMKTRDLTRQVGGSVAGVVFVRSGTGRSPDVDHIADFLSVDLLGHVPEDGAVPNAQDVGLPVVVAESESSAATAYRALGDRLAERIDALDTPSTDALSAESLDRDGSGFAFVDRPTDGDDTNERDDANAGTDDASERTDERAAGAVSRTTNGRVDGSTRDGTDETLSLLTNGARSNTGATSNHEPADRTDENPAVEVGESLDETGEGADGADEASETAVAGVGGEAERAETAEPTDETGTAGRADVEDPTEDSDEGRASEATGTTRDVEVVETADDTETVDDTDDAEAIDDEATQGTDDEATKSEPTGSAETADVEDSGEEDENSERARNGTTESTRSTTKRFIDRARELVDRQSD